MVDHAAVNELISLHSTHISNSFDAIFDSTDVSFACFLTLSRLVNKKHLSYTDNIDGRGQINIICAHQVERQAPTWLPTTHNIYASPNSSNNPYAFIQLDIQFDHLKERDRVLVGLVYRPPLLKYEELLTSTGILIFAQNNSIFLFLYVISLIDSSPRLVAS